MLTSLSFSVVAHGLNSNRLTAIPIAFLAPTGNQSTMFQAITPRVCSVHPHPPQGKAALQIFPIRGPSQDLPEYRLLEGDAWGRFPVDWQFYCRAMRWNGYPRRAWAGGHEL